MGRFSDEWYETRVPHTRRDLRTAGVARRAIAGSGFQRTAHGYHRRADPDQLTTPTQRIVDAPSDLRRRLHRRVGCGVRARREHTRPDSGSLRDGTGLDGSGAESGGLRRQRSALGVPDLLQVESALAIEYDGASWSTGRRYEHRDRDQHREENAREERLERAGLVVVRADKSDLVQHRRALADRLRAARADGLARDRSRDRWTLDEPEHWFGLPA
ncbi:MAG TPA: hypothetical protein VIT65_03715 [Microlunatus sp.]